MEFIQKLIGEPKNNNGIHGKQRNDHEQPRHVHRKKYATRHSSPITIINRCIFTLEPNWENQSNGAQYSSFCKFASFYNVVLLHGQNPFEYERE
jgi:hypothetical protein